LIEVDLPESDSFEIKGNLKGSKEALAFRNAVAAVGQGSLVVKVNGGVGNLMDLSGVNLSLEATGRTLTDFGNLVDTRLPDMGPVHLQATVEPSPGALDVRDISATIDQSDFNGWAKIEMKKRPKITVRLTSALIDVTPLMGEVKKEEEKPDKKTTTKKSLFLSDHPLPFDRLTDLDADVELKARGIRARDADMELGHLTFRIENGELSVDKLEATYKETKVAADLDVAAGTGAVPEVALKFLVQAFDIGSFLEEIRGETEVSGQVDVAGDLKSRGRSGKGLMADLDGTLSVVFGKGDYPRGLDLIAEDLSQRVVPFWGGERKRSGRLNCGVMQFTIREGVATTDSFVFDSERSLMTGGGTINLATEKIDFLLVPRPKNPSLMSLSTKLHVGGSIMDPTVSPDLASAVIKGAKALSFFALGPAGLLAPFVNLGAGDKHSCNLKDLQAKTEDLFHNPVGEPQPGGNPAPAAAVEAGAGKDRGYR
jgi:uncharacterized protein involved in outer membrane biogenesis